MEIGSADASSVKSGVGTPLVSVEGFAPEALRRLAAVSVTTAEELLGIIRADPDGTRRLLEIDHLASLQADAGFAASASATPDLGDAPDEIYWTGVTPPESAEQVEVTLGSILARADEAGAVFPPERAGASATPNFIDCFGPLRHQGTRGTCVAHAVCALVECLEHRATGQPLDLSEQFLYWNAKQHDGNPQQEGTFIALAMDLMRSDGTCLDSEWAYVATPIPGNEGQGPPSAGAAAAATGHKLQSSTDQGSGGARDASRIRKALDNQEPVALSVPVYTNWKGNPMFKLSGFIPLPLPGSAFDSGHAMCAVGYSYDPAFTGGGYFILRNSWGTGFAPNSPVAAGHALLPFAYWDAYGWEAFTGTS